MKAWRTLACALALVSTTATALDCAGSAAWQVLGSGGPELNRRAQSGHVLWLDGRAHAIFDAGAGTAVAFGQAQGHIEDLDLIALSHLHTDHSADVPAYLKAAFFSERQRRLTLLGPPAGGTFPSTEAWIAALVGPEHAAYPYLSGFLQPLGASFQLQATSLSLREGRIATVFSAPGFTAKATPVKHGTVPALAWRVEAKGRSVVYLGDTDAMAPALIELAARADLLVANLAIGEDSEDSTALALHAPPSRIAMLAERAGVRRLLLAHLMRRSEQTLPASLRIIHRLYHGPVDVAHDGLCMPLPADRPDMQRKGPA